MFGDTGRTQYDLSFSLMGIPVRISPYFWFIALLFSPCLTQGGGNTRTNLIALFAWVLAWTTTFLIHELGHALVIQRRYGAHPWIVLYGFGGAAYHQPSYRRIPGSWGRILIAFAGPGAELGGAALLVLLLTLAGQKPIFSLSTWGLIPIPMVYFASMVSGLSLEAGLPAYFFSWFLISFLWMSIFWGILNLLPVYPLDGGQIARNFFVRFSPRYGRAYSLYISMFCAGALALFCFQERSFFAALFFVFFAFNNFQELQVRF